MEARPRRRVGRRRRWARRLLVAGAALLLLWLLRVPILVGIGEWLTVEDELRRADVVFVLGGEVDTRPFVAADLYRRGLAPRVAVPVTERGAAAELGLMPTLTDITVEVLRRRGVPDSAVVRLETLGGTTSTADDARELRRWVERTGARRVIAVTSAHHTRRARWHLRRALRGTGAELLMAGAEDPHYTDHDWWRTEGGMVAYANEYLKWLQNLLAGS